jgi:glycosyltransferase involved in cell wall biosynthesis
MKKATICFISREFPPSSTSGIANYALEVCNGLKEKYNVVVLTEEKSPIDNRIFKLFNQIIKNTQKIWSKDIDVIIANGFVNSITGLFAKIVKRKPLISIVLDVSSAEPLNDEITGVNRFIRNSIYQVIFNHSDRFVCISEKPFNDAKKYFNVDKKKFTVSHISVDSNIHKISGKPFKPKKHDFFRILFVGPLYKKRGFEFLLKALNLLKKDGVKFKCFITGPKLPFLSYKPYYEMIEKIIEDLNLKEEIVFLGTISRNQLIEQYRNCDIFVNTTYHSDGFGMPCVEASLFKKPVVGTTLYEETGVVVNEKTGLLVPKKDFEQLYIAIKRLAMDDKLRREMGVNARKHVLQFSWEKHINVFHDLIEELRR